MARPQKAHWLRENAQERSPRRVVILDTETRPAGELEQDRQVLRLWAATLVRRRGVDPGKPREERARGRTAAELARYVDGLARSDHALWLMTHNLNFDLMVTELPVRLVELGWRITEAALTTDSPWCRLARGSRRMTIADTFSWLPTSVAELGELVGVRKPELPEWDDTDDAWYARCEADVAITARAILSCMDWWDAGHLGNWSITGPATGWSSYRHRRPAPRVLVIPDPEARELEMAAVTGGRRQVNRTGELGRGLYADLDLSTAHLTAMAGAPLPSRRLGAFTSMELDHRALDSTVLDVLARCVVRTEAPRYPWDSGRGVFYPVGTFATVLAGPELREARRRGELVSIGAGYLYLVTPHMADWSLWLASLLDQATPGVPPAVRLMAKHWSRCVPGKWAGRTSEVLRRDPDPRPGWLIERAYLMPERRAADLLVIGGERWTIVRDEWADDAFPAILAWIQSLTRVAMGRLADLLGPAVLSMNTDGALVDARGALAYARQERPRARETDAQALRALDELAASWAPVLAPFQVRVKAAAGWATVLSPQHAILDDTRRLAGIPRRAVSLGGGRYTFTAWPKLRVQLQAQRAKGYHTREATVDLARIPPTGWLLTDGTVEPARVCPGEDGRDQLQVPAAWHVNGLELAPRELQHPALRRVLA